MDDIEHLPLLSIISGYTSLLRSHGTDLPCPGQSSIVKVHTQISHDKTGRLSWPCPPLPEWRTISISGRNAPLRIAPCMRHATFCS